MSTSEESTMDIVDNKVCYKRLLAIMKCGDDDKFTRNPTLNSHVDFLRAF